MIIVSGHLEIDPAERDAYLAGCTKVVRSARATDGCLDFARSADVLDAARINVLEVWQSREVLLAFRGDGPSADQMDAITAFHVIEHEIAG